MFKNPIANPIEHPYAMVVEDNILLANMFSRTLADIDYYVRVMNDGREALEWLVYVDDVPDVILLDMHLPNVSGEKILNVISDDPRFENCYIMIISADVRMAEMLSPKADFVLSKPVDLVSLQQMTHRLKPKAFA